MRWVLIQEQNPTPKPSIFPGSKCTLLLTRWPQARYRQCLTLVCMRAPPQKTPEPTHLVASFRPHQGTTQLVSQITYPKGGLSGHQNPTKTNPQQLVHYNHCQSSQTGSPSVNPIYWCANSNQGSTTTGGHTQLTQGKPKNTQLRKIRRLYRYYIRPLCQDRDVVALPNKHKHRETAKMRQKACAK